MTAKEFFNGFYHFPATLFSGATDLLLGSYKRNKRGDVHAQEAEHNRGLLGYLLDGIKAVSRGISAFISNHKTAIATAFWTSLLLSGAAVLTLFLWPAALTAVTTFTIAGFSIAGVVGTGLVAQLSAVAALTTIASSTATYFIAAVVNTINWIKEIVNNKNSDSDCLYDQVDEDFEGDDCDEPDSSPKMSSSASVATKLSASNQKAASSEEHKEPVHSTPLFSSSDNSRKKSDAACNEAVASSSMHQAL